MARPPYPWLNKLRVQNQLIRDFLAEFLGTFVLVCIADGSLAQSILAGEGVPGILTPAYTVQLGVFAGVVVALNVTGGQVNPIVTVSLATIRRLPWRRVPGMLIGQYLGAFMGSLVVYLVYYDALIHFQPENREVLQTGNIFTTYPKSYVSLWTVFFDSVVAVGVLMIAVMAAIDKRNADMPKWMHPLYFGFFIGAVLIAFHLNNMAPLNPARDLAARIFSALAGWGAKTFEPMNYHYWWIAGVLGPHVGGILGTWLYYLFVELHFPDPAAHNDAKEAQELLKMHAKQRQETEA